MTARGLAAELLRNGLGLAFSSALGWALACTLACALGGTLASCKQEPNEPSVGTNSNWLRACVADAECSGTPTCECGACTLPCDRDTDCDG